MKKILIIIIVLGFFLRVFDIQNNPVALYGDELATAYDAYSIIKTGSDQRGNFLPITFEMGGGRPGGYIYATIPFIAFFGLEALAVRSVSILSGIGIIFLMYLLGKKLIDQKVGLAGAALTAISPWGLALSRGGYESNFALFLTLLGVVSFLYSDKKPWLLILSASVFGLSIHTYSAYKLTTPLMIVLLVLYLGIKKIWNLNAKFLTIAFTIFGLFVLVLIHQILFNGSEKRFLSINVFSQDQIKESIIQKINLDRTFDTSEKHLSILFHNKPIEYIAIILNSFISNLSTDFLFVKGDNNPRHNPAVSGQLYLVEGIFILFAFIFFNKTGNKKIPIFLILWCLIAIIPSVLTLETHAVRGSFALPPLILLSAIGFLYIWGLRGEVYIKSLKFSLVGMLLIQFIFTVQQIYFVSPNKFSRFWSYPAKLASNIALENKDKYKYVILSDKVDNIEFAYPVYAKVDPTQVISQNKNRDLLNSRELRKYNNIYIGYIPENEIEKFVSELDGSVIFITSSEQKVNGKYVELINGLDGRQSLMILRKER